MYNSWFLLDVRVRNEILISLVFGLSPVNHIYQSVTALIIKYSVLAMISLISGQPPINHIIGCWLASVGQAAAGMVPVLGRRCQVNQTCKY